MRRPSPRLVAREYPQQAVIRAFGRNVSSLESIIVVEPRIPGRRRNTPPGNECQIPLLTPTGPRPGLSCSSQSLAGPAGYLRVGRWCSASHAHDPGPPGYPEGRGHLPAGPPAPQWAATMVGLSVRAPWCPAARGALRRGCRGGVGRVVSIHGMLRWRAGGKW